MPSTSKYTPERVTRAARIYATNKDAGTALGITSGSFSRLCKRYDIVTPDAQRKGRTPPGGRPGVPQGDRLHPWRARRQTHE